MSNTQFVRRIQENAAAVTWKDIFSEFRKPHKKEDMDYLLLAGSSLITYEESTMFQRWHKPWLFWRVLLVGLAAAAAVYAVELVTISLYGACYYSALNLLFAIIPPMVTPIALMIFFWELNIPRNISIYQLAACFFGGGLLSIFFTVVFNYSLGDIPAYLAPVTEEPAKLITAILFTNMVSKKSNIKIYGVTGLCIGASVGAGFGAFESAQYAFNYLYIASQGTLAITQSAVIDVFWNSHFLRGILAVGGHTLYCAPYIAAIALHCKHRRIDWEAIRNQDFYQAFLLSCGVHFLWNGGLNLLPTLAKMTHNLGLGLLGQYVGLGCLCCLLWVTTLRITRKCLHQMSLQAAASQSVHSSPSHQNPAGTLVLQIFQEGEKPLQYKISPNRKTFMIGRNPDCDICLPKAPALSRRHCQFAYSNSSWFVQDTQSKFGTKSADGTVLRPGMWYSVRDGMCLNLGSSKVAVGITLTRNSQN